MNEQHKPDSRGVVSDVSAEQLSAALGRPGEPMELRSAPEEHILQFFSYQHLPTGLQAVSALFHNLAHQIVERTPRNPERTVALRKLLESKDAAVRAAIARSE